MSQELELFNRNQLQASLSKEMLAAMLTLELNKQIDEYIAENNKAMAFLQQEVETNKKDIVEVAKKNNLIERLGNSEIYVNRTNLAKNFNIPLSNQRMTKLLRFAGILLANDNNNAYQQFYNGNEPLCRKSKFLKADGYEGYKIQFHQEKTWNRIYNELEKFGLSIEFSNCKTVDELNNLIDNL